MINILVSLPTSFPCRGVEGWTGLPQGDSAPGELAQPSRHLLSSHGHTARPEHLSWLCISTFGTEGEGEEGRGP